jgi:hypothetical protein
MNKVTSQIFSNFLILWLREHLWLCGEKMIHITPKTRTKYVQNSRNNILMVEITKKNDYKSHGPYWGDINWLFGDLGFMQIKQKVVIHKFKKLID